MIELVEVTKSYPMGEVAYQALRGISLRIGEGEYSSVTGASGSGKSTLLHLIGGLHQPTSGDVFLEGENLKNLSREELANVRGSKIGFIFQRFFLLPRVDALYNVELPLVYQGVKPRARRSRARECLKRVGLGQHMDHLPNQLSGGQSQRVAIARALVNSSPLLLCDEPTGNLDSKTGKSIMEIFDELNKEGKTIVNVTHERELAAEANREIILKDGKLKEDRYDPA